MNVTTQRVSVAIALALMLGATGCMQNSSDNSSQTAPSEVSYVGTWGTVEAGKPSLVINEDKSFTGNDGCNQLMGNYSVTEENIVFESPASTMMFCEGVDTWLSRLSTAVLAEKYLVIFDSSGDEIGKLEQQ